MANHDQKGNSGSYVCGSCSENKCGLCLDVLRFVYTERVLCMCRRTLHAAALERAVDRERRARRATPDTPHITCGLCGKTSYHPEDVNTGYCGFCHDFTNGEVFDLERPA